MYKPSVLGANLINSSLRLVIQSAICSNPLENASVNGFVSVATGVSNNSLPL